MMVFNGVTVCSAGGSIVPSRDETAYNAVFPFRALTPARDALRR